MVARATMDDDTIAAIATPLGPGGIGIVRVSGPGAKAILSLLFKPAGSKEMESHRFTYGWVVSPEDGEVVDEAMAVFMEAPRSYTREDVVEFQCHGGPAVVKAVLELVLKAGARPAEPGEFTKRAFLNGRIDLIQAEAVLDLATARTQSQHAAGLSLLSGRLGQTIKDLHSRLLEVMAGLEAAIDYPDEDENPTDMEAMASRLRAEVLPGLDMLLDAYERGHVAREGARVVLAGLPNTGKSSLFNALLGFQRVIVSERPGTTRDHIEETFQVEGVPVTLVDTAGLRASADELERLGIEMAWEQLHRADLVLFLVAGDRAPQPEELEAMERIRARGVEVMVVISRMDLASPEDMGRWRALFPRAVAVAAPQGRGLEGLRAALAEQLRSGTDEPPPVVPTLRQKQLIEKAREAVERAAAAAENSAFPEIVAVDIREACERLGAITGSSFTRDLLDAMFSQFCLGK